MSNVSEVLNAIREASEAFDSVPGLRQRIDELEQALAHRQAALDQKVSDHADTLRKLDETNAKLRSTEEERDGYFFRATEAEDKIKAAAMAVGAVFHQPQQVQAHAGESVSQLMDKPPVEAKPEPLPEGKHTFVPDPTAGATAASGDSPTAASTAVSSPAGSISSSGLGQSDQGPTTTASAPDAGATTHPAPTADPIGFVQPYKDKAYWEKPSTVTWKEWALGGGCKPYYMSDEEWRAASTASDVKHLAPAH